MFRIGIIGAGWIAEKMAEAIAPFHSKVEKYLKKNPYITTEGIEKLIRGSTVRDPMSRRMMRIDDPKLYAKGLIRFMLEQGVIEYAGKDGYCLKNKDAK